MAVKVTACPVWRLLIPVVTATLVARVPLPAAPAGRASAPARRTVADPTRAERRGAA